MRRDLVHLSLGIVPTFCNNIIALVTFFLVSRVKNSNCVFISVIIKQGLLSLSLDGVVCHIYTSSF